MAHAGADDDGTAVVQSVLNEEYASANFGDAKKKLDAALAKCGSCSASTRGQIFVALGMVASQTGKKADARSYFDKAFAADPNAKLPARATPDIRNEFGEAQKRAAAEAAPPATDAPDLPAAPAAGGKIPGWNNAEAFQEATAGLAADTAGKLDQCISHDTRSLELEEQPRTRLHLASCQARSGKLLDALRNGQKALEEGIKKRDAGVMKAARERIQRILPLIPHVTFVPPPGVEDLAVTFDERPVPANALRKKFSIDPGKHTVHAEGLQSGIPLAFDQEYTVREGELLTVAITLKSQAPEYLTPGQLRCMLTAKSQEEVLKCLPQNRKSLVVKATFDFAGYTDTNNVNVYSPEMSLNVTSPTGGWNAGANFLIDVISAASPDIVSMASPPFHETRYAGGVNGGYKLGRFGLSANAGFSLEPDYLNLSAGGAVTTELRDKLIVPRVGYTYMHDTIGRGGTPFDVFHRNLDTHEIDAGITFVLSPTALLLISGSAQFERGDQSKPYRYVPMFDPEIAPRVPVGAKVDVVNANRLNVRPLEQLPTERDRFAVGARFAKRFSSTTLRLEQRFYYDTWGTKGSTTDARYILDLSKHLRVWPHARLHAQTGTDFYQLAYKAVVDNGTLVLPLYRSGDRELAPLFTVTAGGGTRIGLGPQDAKTHVGLTIQADVMHTRFLKSLFVTQRTAVYGSMGFDVEFE